MSCTKKTYLYCIILHARTNYWLTSKQITTCLSDTYYIHGFAEDNKLPTEMMVYSSYASLFRIYVNYNSVPLKSVEAVLITYKWIHTYQLSTSPQNMEIRFPNSITDMMFLKIYSVIAPCSYFCIIMVPAAYIEFNVQTYKSRLSSYE